MEGSTKKRKSIKLIFFIFDIQQTRIKLVVIFNSSTMQSSHIVNIAGKFKHSTYNKIRTIEQQGSLFKVIYEEGGNNGYGEIFIDNINACNQFSVVFWNTCGLYLTAKIQNNGEYIQFKNDVWTRQWK